MREQQVLRSILAQRGVIVPCFRCGVTLSVDDAVQKEHLHERALGGPDVWGNWRWSHKVCHARVTNGTPATCAGSSKNRIAKANNENRIVKFVVNKREPSEPKPASRWPPRKLKSRPFEKGHRPMRRRVA